MVSSLNAHRYTKPLILTSAVLGITLLSLPFLSRASIAEVGLVAFVGRFHPLIVHFPIVLIVLPLIFEGLIYWQKWINLKGALRILWPLAVVSSSAAAFIGYFLLRSGDYAGDMVDQHLWGGVWVSIVCLLTGLAYFFSMEAPQGIWRKVYVGLMVLTNILTIYTGHLGGTLTHGQNYLSDAMPTMNVGSKTPLALKKTEEMLVYEDIIMGVFQGKCMSCHNAHKAKGGLVMETYEDVLGGGKSEKPMLIGANVEGSELFHRIALEEGHDDHMPPAGKPDLQEEEVEMVQLWIEEGANPEQTVEASSARLQQLVKLQLPQLMRFQQRRLKDRKERDKAFKELKELVKHLHLRIDLDPEADSMYFALSMQFPPAQVNDETLEKLIPYAHTFSKISLPSAEITDEGLYTLSRFPNLRELYLQKTCIKGEGVVFLQALPRLEKLSLAHTEIDDFYALEFLEFKSLKRLYLFHTEVGVNVVEVLDQRMKNTEVLSEEGPYY